MLARDHDFRLGQLLATLIYNAGACLQSTEPHPIALIGLTFRGALIGILRSTHRPLPTTIATTGAAIRMTSIVSTTDAEEP